MAPRPRPLHHNEIALWREVTRSIVPLHGKQVLKADPSDLTMAEVIKPSSKTPVPKTAAKAPPKASREALLNLQARSIGAASPLRPEAPVAGGKTTPPLAPIERKLIKQVSRGQYDIDAVLDLHGYRQNDAHERLRRFLHRAQADHARLVLVVTGKGASKATRSHEGEPHAKGVLRRSVPEWLTMPDLRSVVLGFEQAAPHQGGSGALYVRLRRRKELA
jgi:DNA-nicking Smr family endonuclease